MNAEQKLIRVMLDLREFWPYHSAIYESMERVRDDSIGTMGVTTKKLIYNKDFVESMDLAELLFVNLHEIGHVALKHVARAQGKDPNIWNIACDLVVNAIIYNDLNTGVYDDIKDKLGYYPKILDSGLLIPGLPLDDNSAEKLYSSIVEQLKSQRYSEARDGTMFNVSIPDKHSRSGTKDISITKNSKAKDLIREPKSQDELEKESNEILNQAEVRRKMSAGDGHRNTLLERLSNVEKSYKIDWRQLLKKYITKAQATDSSFRVPDKRMVWSDAIYPGKHAENEKIDDILICMDTSGSIDSEILSQFFKQVQDIFKYYKITGKVIFWDTEVSSIEPFKDEKQFLTVKPTGGGGTKPTCVYDYIRENNIKPMVIMMLTDGIFFDDTIKESKYKRFGHNTIWIVDKDTYDEFDTPFGKKAIITKIK